MGKPKDQTKALIKFFNKAKKCNNYEKFHDLYMEQKTFNSSAQLQDLFPIIYKAWSRACRITNTVSMAPCSLLFVYFVYNNNLENKTEEEMLTLWSLCGDDYDFA